MSEARRPVALVTGARQGLGRGIALAMAARGYDVAVMDLLRDDKAAQVLAEIAAAGGRGHFVVANLADIAGHGAMLAEVEAALGPLDVLINNAGIAARPLTDLLDLAPEAFDRNLDINLRGTFFLSQAVARAMLARPADCYRSITFITSIAAVHAATDRAQYCVSKAGLSMVAKLFAARLGEAGIAVHEVRPGFIRTEMTGSAPTAKIDGYVSSGAVPLRRWGAVADVAEVTASLASGALPYVTGQPVYVDGGFHLPQV